MLALLIVQQPAVVAFTIVVRRIVVSIADVLSDGLNMERSCRDKAAETRVGPLLRKLGAPTKNEGGSTAVRRCCLCRRKVWGGNCKTRCHDRGTRLPLF